MLTVPTTGSASSGSRQLRRHRHFADILRDLVALLRCRAFGDGNIPALHVGILVEIDRPFIARNPRPDRGILTCIFDTLQRACQGCLALKLNDATAGRMRNGVGAPDSVKFVDHCTDVELGCVDRYAKAASNRLV